MTMFPSLTRSIGQTERALRSILRQHLDGAGLEFPAWAALTILGGAGSLARDALVRRLVAGQIGQPAEAAATVDQLLASGLIQPTGATSAAAGPPHPDRPAPDYFQVSAIGEATVGPIRDDIARLTQDLFGDLPVVDLEATHRTLSAIHLRAQRQLTMDH